MSRRREREEEEGMDMKGKSYLMLYHGVRYSWQNGTRCRDGVNVLWCHSHLVWLVFEGSIPTCAGFHSENFFVTCDYKNGPSNSSI